MKFGFKEKLLSLTLLPLIVVTLILIISTSNGMKKNMKLMAEESIESSVNSMLRSFDLLAAGNWSYNGESLVKGEKDLNDMDKYLEAVAKNTGFEYTLFWGDTRVITTIEDESGNKILGTKANDEVIDEVINKGNTYFSTDTTINGKKYFAYYTPLSNGKEVVGMLFSGSERVSVENRITEAIGKSLILASVVVIIDLVISILLASIMAKTILKCTDAIKKLANGETDITLEATALNSKDEIGELVNNTKTLSSELDKIKIALRDGTTSLNVEANEINEIANVTSSTIEEIGCAINGVADGATSQAQDTQAAANGVTLISESIMATSENVKELKRNNEQALLVNNETKKRVEELIEVNKSALKSINDMLKQSEINVKSVDNINNIIDVIKGIADQTNLLSLNAQIEAARAGEQGKGFAVVANEVGNLANESSKAADEIDGIIKELIRNINETNNESKKLEVNSSNQIEVLNSTKEAFEDLADKINKIDGSTEIIVDSLNTIDKMKDELLSMIEGLSAISEENAASTEEITASISVVHQTIVSLESEAKQIKDLAETLDNIVKYFK